MRKRNVLFAQSADSTRLPCGNVLPDARQSTYSVPSWYVFIGPVNLVYHLSKRLFLSIHQCSSNPLLRGVLQLQSFCDMLTMSSRMALSSQVLHPNTCWLRVPTRELLPTGLHYSNKMSRGNLWQHNSWSITRPGVHGLPGAVLLPARNNTRDRNPEVPCRIFLSCRISGSSALSGWVIQWGYWRHYDFRVPCMPSWILLPRRDFSSPATVLPSRLLLSRRHGRQKSESMSTWNVYG